LAATDQFFELFEKLGMMFFDPFQQASGKMQPDPDTRMASKCVDKRPVGLLVGFFENVIEVADGLMRMNHQRQRDFVQRVTSADRNTDPIRQRSLRPI
jgi:hypothetical protein